jgi:acyl-CoA reductase-like NAD-dependent aldehyde dehydrogenase
VLELGGKNPTVVHFSANIRTAARRIAFGRFVNSGQICTAPDHVLVWPEVKDELVAELKQAIHDFYSDDPKDSPDYGRIVNRRNFDRLAALISKDNGTVVEGGETDPEELYIAPTVLVDVPVDSPITQDEVFGPILPILEIDSLRAVVDWVNDRPRPLGLYIFVEDEEIAEVILEATNSGDACLNDCSVHPLIPELPFGGVGNSGMGKYHGYWGYEAFTNARGVLYHSARVEPGVRYPPYNEHVRERKIMDKLL